MATSKPKIAGYLPITLHEKFKCFASDNGMSDSQAIAHILEVFFGEPPSESQGELPEDRLAKIEDEIRLLRDMYSPIYAKLFPQKPDTAGIEEVLGFIPADLVNDGILPSESPSDLPQGELPGELPGESPSDLPQGELPGELPGESPSDLPGEPQGEPLKKDVDWLRREITKQGKEWDIANGRELLQQYPDRKLALSKYLSDR